MRYTVELLFDLVADVESYPEFLPFWRDARVTRREGNLYYTEQSIGIGPFNDRFQTKTVLERPSGIVVMPYRAERQFRRFHIEWRFEPVSSNSSTVLLDLEIEPRSRLLGRLAGNMLRDSARTMLTAFERRAHTILVDDSRSKQ